MAKKKAKAKAERRVIVPLWLVRAATAREDYSFLVSDKAPTMDIYGDWFAATGVGSVWGSHMEPEAFEASTPKYMHLKPGGGPLKMKLVRA